MALYIVEVQEVHYSHRIVEAGSEEEAKELAGDAEGFYLEYSHTGDSEHWNVRLEQE